MSNSEILSASPDNKPLEQEAQEVVASRNVVGEYEKQDEQIEKLNRIVDILSKVLTGRLSVPQDHLMSAEDRGMRRTEGWLTNYDGLSNKGIGTLAEQLEQLGLSEDLHTVFDNEGTFKLPTSILDQPIADELIQIQARSQGYRINIDNMTPENREACLSNLKMRDFYLYLEKKISENVEEVIRGAIQAEDETNVERHIFSLAGQFSPERIQQMIEDAKQYRLAKSQFEDSRTVYQERANKLGNIASEVSFDKLVDIWKTGDKLDEESGIPIYKTTFGNHNGFQTEEQKKLAGLVEEYLGEKELLDSTYPRSSNYVGIKTEE